MRSFLFCTTFFGVDKPYEEAPWRYPKWIEYYRRNLAAFGADRIFLMDDGSNPAFINLPGVSIIDVSDRLPLELPAGPVLFRFPTHLGKLRPWIPPGGHGFPGWWRSFTFSLIIAEQYGYSKIFHAESDLFVITQRLADRIRMIDSGWTAFANTAYKDWRSSLTQPRRRWDSNYQHWRNRLRYLLLPVDFPVYPESALQVICRDRFESLRVFIDKGIDYWRTEYLAEHSLPFDKVDSDFVGMRYGEYLIKDYPPNADYVAQSLEPWTFPQTLRG
jgi:hypothetical protein